MIRTKSKGIFQSDILIRTAVMEGLREIREQPWLLDFVFAWLPSDDLTFSEYGDRELKKAQDWFLANNVVVTLAYHQDKPQLPCIGIELLDSGESNATLGDVHHDPKEDVVSNEIIINPSPILGPFVPRSYASTSGQVVLPEGMNTGLVVPGMILFDSSASRGYPIIDVTSESSLMIQPGIKTGLSRAFVAPRDNFMTVPMHSLLFKETYRLTCYSHGNYVTLLYLYTLLVFTLLRFKEKHLEGRGFENSQLSAGAIGIIDAEDRSTIYNRSLTLTGNVRHYWPGEPTKKIDGFILDGTNGAGIKILGGGKSPDGISSQVADQGWEMEGDGLRR